MPQATLNFVEEDLDRSSPLFNLYDRLYRGMVAANEVDAPAFPSSEDLVVYDGDGLPLFDSDGNLVLDLDKKAQAESMAAEYADTLMKNSAYLFANSILSVFGVGNSEGGGGNSSAVDWVSRNGDSMAGKLQALCGFAAGVNYEKIFEVIIDANNKKFAVVSGNLRVAEDAYVEGLMNIGDGIAFGGNNAIYYENGALCIENPAIEIIGDIALNGSIALGDVLISQDGIFCGDKEFYHSGNSNRADVDWTMNNAMVYGDLTVNGDVGIAGEMDVDGGFSLGFLNKRLLYSSSRPSLDASGNALNIPFVCLDSDLDIQNSHGIAIDGNYVVNVKNSSVVSFSAPDMTMNLGDNNTGKISLQSDVWDYSSSYKILTKEGAGYFPNGLVAQSAVSGPKVLQSYANAQGESGILFPSRIRFGDITGPAIFRDQETGRLNFLLTYVNAQADGFPMEDVLFNAYAAPTTSPFRNHSLGWSSTLHFDAEAEFFAFDKPVEASYFAIKSERYKTRLLEDALFFDDGKFIEGVTDGLRFAGNGYFDGNISSQSFASGFAGYGWAIKDQVTEGGYHATFDSLTVRKKMRVYELEVQKIYCTNGSLWVSDFCSGDEVIAIN